MNHKIFFTLLAVSLVLMGCCRGSPEESKTVDFSSFLKDASIDMERIQVMFLTPIMVQPSTFWHLAKYQDIEPQITEIFKNPQYDVVRISTVYVGGKLVKAEIYYRIKK